MLGLITSAVTALVPWAGPRSVLGLGVVALLALGVGSVWLAGEQYGASGRAAAVARCDAKWRDALANSERRYARKIAAARADASAVEPAPADAAALDRLCQQSAACRERGNSAKGAR